MLAGVPFATAIVCTTESSAVFTTLMDEVPAFWFGTKTKSPFGVDVPDAGSITAKEAEDNAAVSAIAIKPIDNLLTRIPFS
jgi:hypothetical protein